MPEFTLTIYEDSIELTCDQCGHVNHWASGIELDEVKAEADEHVCDA